MRALLPAFSIALLASCATYQPVPPDYKGPTAYVADSGQSEDEKKAQVFALGMVDGKHINDSRFASEGASRGHGSALTLVIVDRLVPARPMKVKLMGTHVVAAPILAMASQIAGTWFSVEGVVDFTPEPGGRYVVRGLLQKEGSSVWIEDARTNQPVTEKVVNK